MADAILCVGEVLWDALPAGLFLGGAPLNAAYHLRELGEPVLFTSRVGADELGREVRRRLERLGLSTEHLQTDSELSTGFVVVSLDASGSPTFDIVAPSAWDAIEMEEGLCERARQARAIVFGSLAQRDPRSRETIQSLWESDALMVFDVNLRPPFDRKEEVEMSLRHANIVKLNDTELDALREWFGLKPGFKAGTVDLAQSFDCPTVCVTRGEAGAALWHERRWYDHPGFRVDVLDAVGSGDAFLAALLSGLLAGADAAATLERANALGAFVASQNGATPPHDAGAIQRIQCGEGTD